MSFMNTLLSPTNTYVEIVDTLNSAAEILWNKSESNNTIGEKAELSEREAEAEEVFDLAIANLYARRA